MDDRVGSSRVYIHGALLTGGACDDHDGAGAITIGKSAKVTINDVTIAGNLAASGYNAAGGAINMYNSYSTLVLNNVTMEYNYSANEGGAIYVSDSNNTLKINNSKIQYNSTKEYGGGIYMNDDNVSITLNNSKVNNNYAYLYGGGISSTSQSGNYSTNGLTVKSSDNTGIISNNKSGSDGGGIYATGKGDSFNGLTITNNSASGNGGGIYTNYNSSSNYSAISNCTITGNSANYGGGIWAHRVAITKDTIQNNTARTAGGGTYANEYEFSGVVTIDNNKLSSGSKSDAHIASKYKGSSTSNVGVKGVASYGSSIGIITDKPYSSSLSDKEKLLSTDSSFHYRETSYFSDEGDPVVILLKETLNESTYNYSYELYRGIGSGTTTDYIEVDSQSKPEVKSTYNGKDVLRGYYTHSAVDFSAESDVDNVYYYSDGYFFDDADDYNTHLATMSLAMTMAGFTSKYEGQKDTTDTNSAEYVDEWAFSAKNIVKLYEDLGFDNVYLCDSYDEKPHLTTLGYSFAQKEITDGKNTYTLVPIVIRGNGYGSEWYSNVYIGESGEHKGFSDSAKLALTDLQQYIKDYGLEDQLKAGKVKFWVMGYSRAAACANVLSKYLVDTYKRGISSSSLTGNDVKASGNQIYAYTFATPKGGMNDKDYNTYISNYYCIHNIINNADIVPDVAMEEMGFIRYGVDHYLPGTNASRAKAMNTKTWSYVSEAEDGTSGNVWSTLYETLSDNTYTNTKTSSYTEQRNKMIQQLDISQPYLNFTDNFTTATINVYTGIVVNIYGIIQEYSSNLKAEDFEKIFMRAFQAWGFYDNGTDGDVKIYETIHNTGHTLPTYIYDLENSTKNNLRYNAYKTSAKASIGVDMTLQDALLILFRVYGENDNADTDMLMQGISGAMSNFGFGEYLKVWNRVLGSWDNMSLSYKKGMLDTFWNIIFKTKIKVVDDDGVVHQENLLYYITGDANENTSSNKEFKNAIYVLLDAVIKVFNVDYTNSVKDWSNYTLKYHNVKVNGRNVTYKKVQNLFEGILTDADAKKFKDSISSQTLIMLGTMANNYETILQAHYAEVYSAWLRSYDTYYFNGSAIEKNSYKIKNKTDYGNFKVYASYGESNSLSESYINTITEDAKIELSTTNTFDTRRSTDGAMIQYRIKKGDGSYGKWNIYNDKPIQLDVSDEDYTIQTRAIYLETLSSVSEFKVHVKTASVSACAYIFEDGRKFDFCSSDIASQALSGSSISVSTDDIEKVLTGKPNNFDLSNFKFTGWSEKIISNAGDSSKTKTEKLDSTNKTYTDTLTSGYDTYKFAANYMFTIKKVEFNYNQNDGSSTYKLTNATSSKVITSDYNKYTKPQYRVEQDETGNSRVYVEVTLYEDATNNIYFSNKLSNCEFNYNVSYLEPASATEYRYNESDGSITLTRVYKLKTMHKLTINYVDSEGKTLAQSYSRKMYEDEVLTVTSPIIDGYTTDTPSVTRTMGTSDINVNVVYSKNPTYTLTIKYVDAVDESKLLASTYVGSFDDGQEVTITSPEVAGYTVDQQSVKVTMTENKDVVVKYTANTHTLTIKYVDKDYESKLLASTYTTTVKEGTTVTVTSPTIAGYTCYTPTLKATMGKTDQEITVKYKANYHTLTINYVDENNAPMSDVESYSQDVQEGKTVSVDSPTIEGYTTNTPTVTVTMGTSDQTVTVVYTQVVPATYTLTIKYVDAADESKLLASTYVGSFNDGQEVTITSPEVAGYTADKSSVSVTMTEDKVEVVKYTANTHTLTINYISDDPNFESVKPASYTTTVKEGEIVTVTSPSVNGYTADKSSVSVTMTEDIVEVVKYTANTHTLTIKYVDKDDESKLLANTYTATVKENETVTVTSPSINGYTADRQSVTVTVTKDTEEKVTYKAKTHKLTIKYVDVTDKTKELSKEYTATVKEGEAVNITSPTIDGYTTDTPVVTYTMSTEDKIIYVEYRSIIHTLTIKYVDAANKTKELASTYTASVKEGESVSVASPNVEGYTTKTPTLTLTMGSEDITKEVTYEKTEQPVKQRYTLTIKYVDADTGKALINEYSVSLYEGDEVNVTSPIIDGYRIKDSSKAIVSYTMGTKDYTETIEYNKIPSHTLTINYLDEDENVLTASYSIDSQEGKSVSVASPNIEGYSLVDADKYAIVTYTMGTDEINVVNVYYKKNESTSTHTLTITYTSSDSGFTAPETYSKEIKEGETVSVASPEVSGYTPDKPTVTITMGKKDISETVTYTKSVETVNVTVNFNDANSNTTLSTAKYAAQKGGVIYITATDQDDEEFIGWSTDGNTVMEKSTDIYTIDGDTISFTVNNSDTKLYALYKPVVKKAVVTAPKLNVDKKFVTSIDKGITVSITNDYSFNTILTWEKLDNSDSENPKWVKVNTESKEGSDVEKVAYQTTYKAKITLDAKDLSDQGFANKFTIGKDAVATIDGKSYSILNDGSAYYIEYIYTTGKEKAKVFDETDLGIIELEHNVTKQEILDSLNEYVKSTKANVEMSDGSIEECSITLTDISDIDTYEVSDEYQIYIVTASVNLDGLYNPDNIKLDYYIIIGVAGLPEEDEPEADMEEGLYYGNLYVNLSSSSGGTILYTTDDYWTLDDDDINWKEFKEGNPIELTPDYQKDENGNYITDEDGNLVPTDQIIYAYVKGRKGISSSSFPVMFVYQVADLAKYTVKYDLNGGSPASGVSYDDEIVEKSTNILKAAPSKIGYTFTYWQVNNYEQALYKEDEEIKISEDSTIKALWQANTYTIIFNPNGGSGLAKVEYMTYGNSLALLSNTFTRDGYTFIGWNTKADGSGTSYTDGQSVSNLVSEANGHITLYAQWSNNSGNHAVTCEEFNHSKNWTWSESQGKCVYKVLNTDTK